MGTGMRRFYGNVMGTGILTTCLLVPHNNHYLNPVEAIYLYRPYKITSVVEASITGT